MRNPAAESGIPTTASTRRIVADPADPINTTARGGEREMASAATHWPWNQRAVPPGCAEYDAAVWHAIRAGGDGDLPRQTLDEWCAEQCARLHRGAFAPEPQTAPGTTPESLIGGVYDLSPEARGRLLAEFAPLFGRVERMRPAVWHDWLRERLEVVLHAAPVDASETAAWAADELERVRPLSAQDEHDDALVRIFHAARHIELAEVSR